MMILIDNSPAQIEEKEKLFRIELGQLQTPLSRRRIVRPYGLDNGCFARFKETTWRNQVKEATKNKPIFVCLPDIVGDARRTLELFHIFEPELIGLPKALVLQNGIGDFDIPWPKIDAVFVGGSDDFKISPECINACKAAKILGKWVHVGRVNTSSRLDNWVGLGDSIDGSGISKYNHMLKPVVDIVKGQNQSKNQMDFIGEAHGT